MYYLCNVKIRQVYDVIKMYKNYMKKVLLGLFIVCFSANAFAQVVLESNRQITPDVYAGYKAPETFTADGFADDNVVAYSNPGGQTQDCIPGKPTPDCCFEMENFGFGLVPKPKVFAAYCPVGSGVFATILMGLGYVFVRSRRKE